MRFVAGQRVRWLCKPIDGPPRGIYAVVEEVGAETVTIRINGPDGDYFRKVQAKKLFLLPSGISTVQAEDDMKISQLFPSKFVKAADLNGKTVTLTIKNLVLEELGHGNEKERKPVLYFEKATKGMILNATNGKTIAGLYGDESDDWTGKRIAIYPDRVRAFGKMHDVIRVREEIPAQPKPGPQSPPPVEENEIDDEEDVTDADEGPIERRVDPATGEITDSVPADEAMWEPDEPVKPKQAILSQAQLTRLNILGTDLYGKKEWDEQRPKMVTDVSKGAITSSKDLTPGEANTLIKALEKKLNEVATIKAARTQTKAQPQLEPHF